MEVKKKVENGAQQAKEALDSVKPLEKVYDELDADLKEIQSVVGNDDNTTKKDKIRLRGLKEGIENSELLQYLEEVFTGCLGVQVQVGIRIVSEY